MNKTGASILCVIDFSEASKDALQAAINVAGSTKSRLTILYPYRLNQPRNVSNIADWKRSIDADATSNFTRMTSSILKESDVLWEFKPEVGFIDDRVEAFTGKHNVGLVVISAELTRASSEVFQDMLEKLKCPLLIVPDKRKQES